MKVLEITASDLFAIDYIMSNEELINNINLYISKIKDDNKSLEKVYRIIRDLVED